MPHIRHSAQPDAADSTVDSGSFAGRDTCYRCFHPTSHCYCSELPSVSNRTGIVIVQHPRERFHSIGTARIAELGLEKVQVLVNSAGRYNHSASALPLPANCGLLYPSPNARDLESLSETERPDHLVILDGTWHHAHTLFRDIPALEALPRFAFKPKRPSQYKLRREPHKDYVSTIEAIVHALNAVDPNTPDLNRLLDVFHQMIARQEQSQVATGVGRTRKRKRPEGIRRLARAFSEDYQRAVIVYGEGYRPRATDGNADRAAPRRLVHWVAQRVDTGECFEAFLKPGFKGGEPFLKHMAIGAAEQERAISSEEFKRRWDDFTSREDILVAWNQGTVALLEDHALWRGEQVFLKAVYHTVCKSDLKSGGALEQLAAAEGLTPVANPFRGRAASRFGNARALSDFLAARGQVEQ